MRRFAAFLVVMSPMYGPRRTRNSDCKNFRRHSYRRSNDPAEENAAGSPLSADKEAAPGMMPDAAT